MASSIGTLDDMQLAGELPVLSACAEPPVQLPQERRNDGRRNRWAPSFHDFPCVALRASTRMASLKLKNH